MNKKIWYGHVLYYLNSSLIISILLIPSELATASFLYKLAPLTACVLVYIWFLICKKNAGGDNTFKNRLSLIFKTFAPLVLAAFLAFWPLKFKGVADGIWRWWEVRPLHYSGISWPVRQIRNKDKPSNHKRCLNEAKANAIKPIRVVTCEFKLSVPNDSVPGRYYTYVDITSKYPDDWVLLRAFPILSNKNIVKILEIGDSYEHWEVMSIPPGEYITFVSCWQNIGSIIPRIKCKNAISIDFRESDRE